jgi:hypothetical protein
MCALTASAGPRLWVNTTSGSAFEGTAADDALRLVGDKTVTWAQVRQVSAKAGVLEFTLVDDRTVKGKPIDAALEVRTRWGVLQVPFTELSAVNLLDAPPKQKPTRPTVNRDTITLPCDAITTVLPVTMATGASLNVLTVEAGDGDSFSFLVDANGPNPLATLEAFATNIDLCRERHDFIHGVAARRVRPLQTDDGERNGYSLFTANATFSSEP